MKNNQGNNRKKLGGSRTRGSLAGGKCQTRSVADEGNKGRTLGIRQFAKRGNMWKRTLPVDAAAGVATGEKLHAEALLGGGGRLGFHFHRALGPQVN